MVTEATMGRIWIAIVDGKDEDAAEVEADAETTVLVEEQVRVILEAELVALLRELSNSMTKSSRSFCWRPCTLFTDRVSLSVSSLSAGGRLYWSEELMEQLRDFFFLRGGATGPDEVMESVVLDWASFVLAITSGSCKTIEPTPELCAEDAALGIPVVVAATSLPLCWCLGDTLGVLIPEEVFPTLGGVLELVDDVGCACCCCCACCFCCCAFNEARDSRSMLIAGSKRIKSVSGCYVFVKILISTHQMDQCCPPRFGPRDPVMSCSVCSSHLSQWP